MAAPFIEKPAASSSAGSTTSVLAPARFAILEALRMASHNRSAPRPAPWYSSRVAGGGVVLTEGNYLALESGGWEGARARIDLLVMLDVAQDELIRRLIEIGRASCRERV